MKVAAPAPRPIAPRSTAPRSTAWADLRLRTLSAVVLAPLALAAIWFGGLAWVALLALGFCGLAVEWVQLCGRKALSLPGALVTAAVLASGVLALAGLPWFGVVPLLGGALLLGLAVPAGPHRAALAWGVPYLGIPLVALVWLRGGDAIGRADLILVVLVVWTTDIGAYIAGRLFGGAKLAPRISPGKTWSGAAGGLAAAMLLPPALVALSFGWRPEAMLVAGLLSVLAQAGDLFESGIKRHFGVKDSGHLIPGHGGLLDRLDGLLAAAPAAALLAALAGRGVLL